MKRASREKKQLEAMRVRFQQCGIAVNEAQPEHDGGIEILPDVSTLWCLVRVCAPGAVRYILRLRLLSDNANRVISGFIIETDTDPVRILEPREPVPSKYLSWDPAMEDILNDHVGQPFGPTLFREGLLLGESLNSPAIDRHRPWAKITVVVVDQFDNAYEETFAVRVCDETSNADWASSMRPGHERAGLFEPDEDATPEEQRRVVGKNAIELPRPQGPNQLCR